MPSRRELHFANSIGLERTFLNLIMSNLSFQIAYYTFHMVCSLATICFISYCLYKYGQNEDLSQVTFQEFHKTKDNIYPSLTICVSTQFSEENLELYGEGINISTYTDFLNGELWDDRMVEIDYDNVTFNFEDYLLGIGMWVPDWRYFSGEEYFLYDHRKLKSKSDMNNNASLTEMNYWKPKFYTSYRGVTQKCFTVDVPFTPQKKVWTFGIVFDSDIFPDGRRPYYYEFGVKAHYPGQFFNPKMQRYVWDERNENSSEWVTMRFKIQKLEVIKHRQTSKTPCNQNWKKDDEEIMAQKVKSAGCRPSHWKTSKEFPICTSKEQMETFLEINVTRYEPACTSIQKIVHTYQEFEILEDWTQEWLDQIDHAFEVMLEFQDSRYMEIQQVRSYGVEDVVGDIGGYLGLFLGFALLQIPELFFNIYSWVEVYFLKQKRTINRIIPNPNSPSDSSIETLGRKAKQYDQDITMIKHAIEDIRSQLQQFLPKGKI